MAPEILVLKPNCDGCGTTTDLYGSTCRHMTVCMPCGKSLVETGGLCTECNGPISRLIREYTVKHHAPSKHFFVGRFHQGIPNFSKRKTGETKWGMHKEGAQGRQLTEAQREKYKLKPWIMEDDIGVQQFIGQLEGGQQATYFLLIMTGSDFQALPAGNWYNFHKVAQYKQLTLEEAEEQMKNRRKTADGYQRWMMKAANTGAAAFGVTDIEEKISGGGRGGSGGRRKGNDDDDDGLDPGSDKGEEDEDEEEARTKRLGLKQTQGGEEDGEEPALDLDDIDEEPEKGDDWEHEETFTDDDEAVGNDPEERIDQENPEAPPPPEIKQEEEDEEEEEEEGQQEEGGGLSTSGKEMKKLLGKVSKEDTAKEKENSNDDEDEEEDEDIDLDNEDTVRLSPVLAPTRKEGPKEEPVESTPVKPTPPPKPSQPASAGKGKRKAGDETKGGGGGSAKKAKAEPKSTTSAAASKKDVNAAVKAATTAAPKPAPAASAAAAKPAAPATQAVTEDEVMKVLKATGPIKSTDLVAKFRSRLRSPQDKSAFAAILKKISRIQKTDGANYIVLRS
ncbi:hypothetical protein R1sor_007071 [Riccia sorocarpa]|uniref:Transcription initiation factor IIF subunit alpha n=1 Tax=Riccia sorocarpa TaxID=122646 RepID=A0ABD3HPC6_9MARC